MYTIDRIGKLWCYIDKQIGKRNNYNRYDNKEWMLLFID